jgi:hypothetical protein
MKDKMEGRVAESTWRVFGRESSGGIDVERKGEERRNRRGEVLEGRAEEESTYHPAFCLKGARKFTKDFKPDRRCIGLNSTREHLKITAAKI